MPTEAIKNQDQFIQSGGWRHRSCIDQIKHAVLVEMYIGETTWHAIVRRTLWPKPGRACWTRSPFSMIAFSLDPEGMSLPTTRKTSFLSYIKISNISVVAWDGALYF
jgi:hypothetical protein